MSGRAWSKEDLRLLADLYPRAPKTSEIAMRLKRSVASTYNAAFKLGLAKSSEFLNSEESGRIRKGQTVPGSQIHQFRKGQVPQNKGLRRPGWHAGRMKDTQFKKGCRSGIAAKNWKPIGTIRADSEGYLRIKVREAEYGKEATGFGNTNVWPLLSRRVWQQHNGPIPPQHIVIFKDGNRGNCAIENLELMSMADNARRNRMWNRFPRELAETIQLAGALKRKIRRLDGQK